MITEQQLKQIAPNCKIGKELVVVLNQLLPKYNINTPLRLAHFFSQHAHETMGFTRFVENTNYTSPDRLMAVVGGDVRFYKIMLPKNLLYKRIRQFWCVYISPSEF